MTPARKAPTALPGAAAAPVALPGPAARVLQVLAPEALESLAGSLGFHERRSVGVHADGGRAHVGLEADVP